MKAGDLDQRVTVERFTSTEDELGQPIETWAPLFTCWAAVEPLTRVFEDLASLSTVPLFMAAEAASLLLKAFTALPGPMQNVIMMLGMMSKFGVTSWVTRLLGGVGVINGSLVKVQGSLSRTHEINKKVAFGIAVVYAFLVGTFFYRRLKLARLPALLLASGVETAVVMLLLGLSEPFAWVVAVEQIPLRIMETMAQVSTSPWVFLLLVNLALLLIGIPLETAPALTIVTPVLAPMALKMGIDPIHLGVVVCFNLVLGLITPPVGAVLFSICGIAGISLERLSRGIWTPFLLAVGVLLIVTFVPQLSTWLPSLLLGGK